MAAMVVLMAAAWAGAAQPASAPAARAGEKAAGPASAPASRPTSRPATTTPAGKREADSKLPLRKKPAKGLPTISDDNGSGWPGRMLSYLLVILVLGAAAIVVVKKVLPRLNPAAAGKGIRVLDSTYLGPRKQVHVLQVGPQRFLVASCRDSISMLSELSGSFSEVYEKQQASSPSAPQPGEEEGEGKQ